MTVKPIRIAVAALSFSAAGLGALVLSEGYTDRAVVPTRGDRPTVGFGSTFREDGSPVALGDTITPPKAVARTLAHVQKDERGLKRCVTAPLTQGEYDLMVDFGYQYGVAAQCASSIVEHANTGRYRESCEVYRLYKWQGKRPNRRDCSRPVNWGPKGCKGVWLRAEERAEKCLREQRP